MGVVFFIIIIPDIFWVFVVLLWLLGCASAGSALSGICQFLIGAQPWILVILVALCVIPYVVFAGLIVCNKDESLLSRLSLGVVSLLLGGYCSVCDLLSSISFYITSFTYIGLVMGAVTGGILGLIFLPVTLAEVVIMVGIAFCLGPIAQTLLSSSFFDGGFVWQIVSLLMKSALALLSILFCCTVADMYPKCYGFIFGGTTIGQSIYPIMASINNVCSDFIRSVAMR